HLFFLIGLIGFVGVALGLAVLALHSNLQAQSSISPDSLQHSAATHDTRAGLLEGMEKLIEYWNANQISAPVELLSSAPPTRSSIMESCDAVDGAQGYLLDDSTSNSFSSYVNGYHGLDVGNVNGRAVTGLNPGTTYYYRVRPYTAATSGSYSNV